MSAPEPGMLFGVIPDGLFRPLAGRAREVYSEVLVDLNTLMGDEGSDDDFSREIVRNCIAETLRRLDVADLDDEGEEYEAEPGDDPTDLTAHVYTRLRRCGWINEERDGFSFRASMPFAAADLLATLCRIRARQNDRYGVRVFSVFNQLRSAVDLNEPHAGAALAGAAREASEFGRHLRQMANDVKAVVDLVASLSEQRDIYRAFFGKFVEGFLVADYTLLKTAQNPFRYHADVMRMAGSIDYKPELRMHLARSLLLMDSRPDSQLEAALNEVDRYSQQITRAFSRINERLAKIDLNRARVEAKARNLVLYSNTTTPGSAGRIDALLKNLLRVQPQVLEMLDIGNAVPVSTGHALSEFTLATPKAKRRPVVAEQFRERTRDMEQALRRSRLMDEYMARIKPTQKVVREYLQTLTEHQPVVDGGHIMVDDAQSLIMFLTLRSLNRLGQIDRRILKGFEIEPLPGYIENEYCAVPNFRLRRIGDSPC